MTSAARDDRREPASESATRQALRRWMSGVISDEFGSALRWAEAAGLAASTITRFLANEDAALPTVRTVVRLATAATLKPPPEVTIPFSIRATDETLEPPPAGDALTGPIDVPLPGTLPQDVPVLGVTVAGNEGDFTLNGEIAEYVRRPPGLARTANVFALYVQNDSMEPRFESGDLVYVHAGRPVSIGRDVIVELHGTNGDPGPCYVKRLLRRTATEIVLLQYNPKKEFRIAWVNVKAMHRIVTPGELLGV